MTIPLSALNATVPAALRPGAIRAANSVTLGVTFTDAAGDPVDPDSVTLSYGAAGSTPTVIAGQKTAVGLYEANVLLPSVLVPQLWRQQWVGDLDANEAVVTDSFRVLPNPFDVGAAPAPVSLESGGNASDDDVSVVETGGSA
jgi:hypothetical protein